MLYGRLTKEPAGGKNSRDGTNTAKLLCRAEEGEGIFKSEFFVVVIVALTTNSTILTFAGTGRVACLCCVPCKFRMASSSTKVMLTFPLILGTTSAIPMQLLKSAPPQLAAKIQARLPRNAVMIQHNPFPTPFPPLCME